MKKEQLSEHYEIINNPNMREMNRIRLTKTPYKGVVYAYGNIKASVVQGEPMITYIYEVFDNPNRLDLDNDNKFKDLISSILDEIITNSLKQDD